MTDLVTFVRARLADRETLAKAAFWDTGASAEWRAEEAPLRSKYHESWVVLDGLDDGVVGIDNPEAITAKSATQHIAANDPAYVLRDIAAKRAIVDELERNPALVGDPKDPLRNMAHAHWVQAVRHRDRSRPPGLPARVETAMTDLISFIRARLDEEEYRQGGPTLTKIAQDGSRTVVKKTTFSRAARDVAAKRAIIDAYKAAERVYEDLDGDNGSYAASCAWYLAVQHLAAIDSDHPDYDESWRP